MAILYIGALRFVGLFSDLGSLPVDTQLLGAIFDTTDTLQRYLFDGSNWLEAPEASPLTTKGDLYTFDTDNTRLPVGSDGQILSANAATATGLEWITNSAFSSPLTTDGDIMIYNTTDVRLGIGGTNQVLTVVAGFPAWANVQGASPLTTKGDVYGFSTVDDRLPIGTQGQVLSVDSVEDLGIKWIDPPATSPLTTKGDLLGFSTLDVRFPIGTDDFVLTADSTTATGLAWKAGGGGGTLGIATVESPDGTRAKLVMTNDGRLELEPTLEEAGINTNFALLDAANIFTEDQTIKKPTTATFVLESESAVDETQIFDFSVFAQNDVAERIEYFAMGGQIKSPVDGAEISNWQFSVYKDGAPSQFLSLNGSLGMVIIGNDADLRITGGKKLFLDGGGDTYLGETVVSNSISCFAGGTEGLRIGATATTVVNGDFAVTPTAKIFLDNSGDTYIHEKSANIVVIQAGGVEMVEIKASQNEFILPALCKLYLDGEGDTYITEASANSLHFVAGGNAVLGVDTQVVIAPYLGALATTAQVGFLNISGMAGPPTGNASKGTAKYPMVFDSVNDKLWINTTGSTWKGVVLT